MNDSDARALRDFDHLPESAYVRLPVVAALFSVSRPTVWRWVRAGHLPEPRRIAGVALWRVAALRARLSEPSGRATDDFIRSGCGD